MTTKLEQIAVVGASLAGLRTVEALRRQGYEGRIVVVGAERHLPYDRPPLSKEVLAGKWDGERAALRKEDAWDELEVDWRLGAPATGLDLEGRAVLVGEKRIPFDALFVATGATPRTLPGTPPLPGIHVLRTLEDSLAIREAMDRGARVAVVGGGVIGGEVAAVARTRGLEATMIELAPVPLERAVGAEMGRVVAQLHRDHGVDVRLGVRVEAFLGGDRLERLRLSDGTHVNADVCVIGVGAFAETRWLEGSGLALEDGVVCSATCEASAPGIYAVGDVSRFENPRYGELMRIEHWTHATEQADAAVAALLAGSGAVAYAPVPYAWSDQYDVKIQVAGRPAPDDRMVVVDGAVADRRFVALYARGDTLTGVLGFSRPRLVMKYRGMIRDGVGLREATEGITPKETA